MIRENSASYPVAAAIRTAGVEPYLGYAFAHAYVRHLTLPEGAMAQDESDAAHAVSTTFNALVDSHGAPAARRLNERLFVAWTDGRIRQSAMG